MSDRRMVPDGDRIAAAWVEMAEAGTPRRRGGGGGGKAPLVVGLLAALALAPFAVAAGEGRSLTGGERNPGTARNANLTQETQIIGNLSGYTTRQSNKSARGGGAIYGCRARQGRRPCIRANNLRDGRAFEFATSGRSAGRIQVGSASVNRNATPFTTNAAGLVRNLNADMVDGMNASQIADTAVNRVIAPGPDGVPGGARVEWARVNRDGELEASSAGDVVSMKSTGTGQYFVKFNANVDNCALLASLNGRRGTIEVNQAEPFSVEVKTWNEGLDLAGQNPDDADLSALIDLLSGLGAITTPADRGFSVVAVCGAAG